jgi:DNA-binding MarR family transcriptional regulator
MQVSDPAPDVRHVIDQLIQIGVDIETIASRYAQLVGLHPTDVRALRVLSNAPDGLTAGELAHRLALTSGATTRMIDRMEGTGHVARVRAATDRRVVRVQMTARAIETADAFFSRFGPTVDSAVAGSFTPAELTAVARFLAAAGSALRTAAADGPDPAGPGPSLAEAAASPPDDPPA